MFILVIGAGILIGAFLAYTINRVICTPIRESLRILEAMTDGDLLAEILRERYRELAFEGHRWYDLRRTIMPAITKTYQGETYTLDSLDTRYTLRFPTEAVEANPEIELMTATTPAGQ